MPGSFAYDIPSNTITVTDGTDIAPATFHDMFLADGVGGWGVVDEIVADAMYKIDCNVNFGDGETSTYFTTLNEMIYFEDDKYFTITDQATLQSGKQTDGTANEGSTWSLGASGLVTLMANGATDAVFNLYNSTMQFRTAQGYRFRGGTIDIQESSMGWKVAVKSYLYFDCDTLNIDGLYISYIAGPIFYLTPTTFNNFHIGGGDYGIRAEASMTAVGANLENIAVAELRTSLTVDVVLTLKDSVNPVTVPRIDKATGEEIEQYTCNIHVADEDGADLETVSIACTTFGNVVSNDAGGTFYKCIEDHTSGVFATDVAADKWELTTAAYAALAGCTGVAQNGAWVTGIDYKKSATEFTGITTDAAGDIAEQTIDYKKWVGTSEALLTYSPHKFTLTHADYPDFTINDVTVDHPIVWRHEMGISDANLTTLI